MAASSMSRTLRLGRLGVPAAVPPLTCPPPPRPLLLGFHRRELSLRDLLERNCVPRSNTLKICPVIQFVGERMTWGFDWSLLNYFVLKANPDCHDPEVE